MKRSFKTNGRYLTSDFLLAARYYDRRAQYAPIPLGSECLTKLGHVPGEARRSCGLLSRRVFPLPRIASRGPRCRGDAEFLCKQENIPVLLGKGNHGRAVEVQRDRNKRAGQLTMPRKKRLGGRYARPRFYSSFYLHLARVLLCTLPSPTPSTRTYPSLTCHLRIVVDDHFCLVFKTRFEFFSYSEISGWIRKKFHVLSIFDDECNVLSAETYN